MVRGIYLITAACTLDNVCYGNVWNIRSNDEMAAVLGMLAFDAVFYFVLFLYLDQVMPRTYGIAKHPLFCFQPLLRLCRRRGSSEYDVLVEDPHPGTLDSDVAAEEALVDSLSEHSIQQDYPLVLQHLNKRYDGSAKHAVRNLSLAVGKSQVLGLLGENGAGKTTTIAMLTGLYSPSSGDARVNGHSIVRDIDAGKQKKKQLCWISMLIIFFLRSPRFDWRVSSVQHSLGQFDCARAFALLCALERRRLSRRGSARRPVPERLRFADCCHAIVKVFHTNSNSVLFHLFLIIESKRSFGRNEASSLRRHCLGRKEPSSVSRRANHRTRSRVQTPALVHHQVGCLCTFFFFLVHLLLFF